MMGRSGGNDAMACRLAFQRYVAAATSSFPLCAPGSAVAVPPAPLVCERRAVPGQAERPAPEAPRCADGVLCEARSPISWQGSRDWHQVSPRTLDGGDARAPLGVAGLGPPATPSRDDGLARSRTPAATSPQRARGKAGAGAASVDCAHRHCAICLEDSGDAGPPWSELRPCAHAFHGPCLRRWLEVQNTCPVCRVAVTELDGSPVAEARLRVEAEEYAPYGDVICQECHGGDDEGLLLLCDGCDRGFHTYCVALGDIPQGQWFCPACAREMARRGLRPDDVDPCAAELAVLELLDFDAALIASYLAEGAAGVRAGRGARRGRRRQQRAESDGESGSGSGEEEGSVEVQVVGEVRGGRGGARDARTKGSVQAGGGEAVGDVTSGGRGKRGLGEKRGRGDEGSHGLRERPRKRVLRTGRVARPPRPWWATGADGAAVGRRARDC